jgi:hypothetical protein
MRKRVVDCELWIAGKKVAMDNFNTDQSCPEKSGNQKM